MPIVERLKLMALVCQAIPLEQIKCVCGAPHQHKLAIEEVHRKGQASLIKKGELFKQFQAASKIGGGWINSRVQRLWRWKLKQS